MKVRFQYNAKERNFHITIDDVVVGKTTTRMQAQAVWQFVNAQPFHIREAIYNAASD